MKTTTDIFAIFDEDDSFKYIMRRLLEASMEHSFNGIMITEAKEGYPIVYVNPALCEMTGYAPEELIGQSPSILQGPETDQSVLDRLKDEIPAGKLFHGQTTNYRKDKSTFTMEWKIAPIRSGSDDISHFLAIQRDVSIHRSR